MTEVIRSFFMLKTELEMTCEMYYNVAKKISSLLMR